jgi:hypothetical protein
VILERRDGFIVVALALAQKEGGRCANGRSK